MKMTKLRTAILAIVLIAVIATASAALVIWSNIEYVHVTYSATAYTLTLVAPTDVYVNVPIDFTGSLTLNGSPIVGATISIICQNGIVPGVLAGATTDGSGTFTCSYTPTAVGDYQFVAVYYP